MAETATAATAISFDLLQLILDAWLLVMRLLKECIRTSHPILNEIAVCSCVSALSSSSSSSS